MKILVSGLINLETSTNVHSFPIEYEPITYAFNEVETSISGVGYNVLMALLTLGDKAIPMAVIGEDIIGDLIISDLAWKEVTTRYIQQDLQKTPISTVLFDDEGNRRIYCDLKDIQDKTIEEPDDEFDAYVLTNINFNKPLIEKYHKEGKKTFCDVHAISDINDEYNSVFMSNSDVLFLSDENVNNPFEFIKELQSKYKNEVVVMGCGSQGALMLFENVLYQIDALKIKNVKNTVGAGDALFSAFVHFYLKNNNPLDCLKLATIFASYKISECGGSNGFLPEKDLLELSKKLDANLTIRQVEK